MNRSVRVVMLSAAALALLFAAGCNKLKARDQLNKGVQAYKNAKFEEAINQYKQVLGRNPSREQQINSVKGIAYLYLQMKKFDLAKEYYRKASTIDPNDPETYYSVGVIDWTECYQPRMEERAKLGLKPDDSLKDKKVCQHLKDVNGANIQDGIDVLNKALQLR